MTVYASVEEIRLIDVTSCTLRLIAAAAERSPAMALNRSMVLRHDMLPLALGQIKTDKGNGSEKGKARSSNAEDYRGII